MIKQRGLLNRRLRTGGVFDVGRFAVVVLLQRGGLGRRGFGWFRQHLRLLQSTFYGR